MATGSDTRRLKVVVTGDSTDAQSSMETLGTKSEAAQGKLGKLSTGLAAFAGGAVIGAATVGVTALGSAITDGIGKASDLNETINKTNQIFGKNAPEIMKWADSSVYSFGLTQQAALASASSFGDMFKQLGFTGDAAAQNSQKVVQLAADLGSFHNLKTEDVLEKVSAAFRGEYDSIQSVLPAINAARVEKEALAATGKENAKTLTMEEKAGAVLSIMYKDGASAVGDFARTSDGLANRQKILAAQFDELKTKLGTSLLPLINNIAAGLSKGIEKLEAWGGAFRKWLEESGTLDKLKTAWDNFQKTASTLWDNFTQGFEKAWSKMGPLIEDVKTAWGEIQPAVDDLRNTLTELGKQFDQVAQSLGLENWQELAKIIGALVGGSIMVSLVGTLTTIAKTVKIVVEAIDLLVKGFLWLGDEMEKFGATSRAIWEGIWAQFGDEVQVAWTLIQTAVSTGVEAVKGVIEPLMDFVIGTVIPAWITLKDGIVDAWSLIQTAIDTAWGFIRDNIFSPLMDFLVNTLIPSWVTLKDGIAEAWSLIQTAIDTAWGFIRDNIFTPLMDFLTNTLIPAWVTLKDGIATAWTEIQTAIETAWTYIRDTIFTPLMAFFTETLLPAWVALKTGIAQVWTDVTQVIADWWIKTQELFATVKQYFDETLIPMWNGLKEGIKGVFDGIIVFAQAFRDTIISTFDQMVQGVVDSVNGLIDFLNTMIEKVNSTFKLKIAKVPRVEFKGGKGGQTGDGFKQFKGLATGGILPGYSPGRDPHVFRDGHGRGLALSGGEAVMRPEWTRGVGTNFVNWMNAIAKKGPGAVRKAMFGVASGPPSQAFANGGTIDLIIKAAAQSGIPHGGVTSAGRNTADYHGQNMAVDFGGYGQDAFASWWLARGASLLELIHQTSRLYGIKNGANNPGAYSVLFSSPDDSMSHKNHVHVAAQLSGIMDIISGRIDPPGAGSIPGLPGIGAGVVTLGQMVQKKIMGFLGDFTKKLPKGTGLFDQVTRDVMGDAGDGIKEFILDSLPIDKLFGGSGAGGAVGASKWASLASKVLDDLGVNTGSNLQNLLTSIGQESGGNPNAVQNGYIDVNTMSGDLAKGLNQVIGSTFNRFAGIHVGKGQFDPYANIYASVRYAMAAYGNEWSAIMAKPGGYATGTKSAQSGWAWAGENGPELINFRGGEEVMNNRKSLDAVSGTTVNIQSVQIVMPPGANFQDPKEFAKQVRDELIKIAGRNGGMTGLPSR